MNLIDEYINQQSWRNWDQYIAEIPVNNNDRVIDLGCSVGGVSNIFSKQAEWVTGIDLNKDFIEFCLRNKQKNQSFICADIASINYAALSPITGIWSSFSLSYLHKPNEFIRYLYTLLQPEGWIALVDVSCFISGNMLPRSKHYSLVRDFERESYKSGSYDFDFGSKMEVFLRQAGFEIVYVNDNITDPELNFDGKAIPQIVSNWKSRLARLQGLRNTFPDSYPEICEEVIASLQSQEHSKNNNVRFVVAKKI